MQELQERVKSRVRQFYDLKQRHAVLAENRLGLENRLKSLLDQHKAIIGSIEDHSKALEVMKAVITLLSEKGLQRLKTLLTFGMSTIFEGEPYEIDIEISERGNVKTAEFWLLTRLEDGTVTRVRIRDSVGGGIQCMVSLILRIYFIIQLGCRRFICLDEALSQLSEAYVDGLFKFMQSCVTDLGFRVLFVAHDPRFIPFADRTYRMTKGVLKEEKK